MFPLIWKIVALLPGLIFLFEKTHFEVEQIKRVFLWATWHLVDQHFHRQLQAGMQTGRVCHPGYRAKGAWGCTPHLLAAYCCYWCVRWSLFCCRRRLKIAVDGSISWMPTESLCSAERENNYHCWGVDRYFPNIWIISPYPPCKDADMLTNLGLWASTFFIVPLIPSFFAIIICSINTIHMQINIYLTFALNLDIIICHYSFPHIPYRFPVSST